MNEKNKCSNNLLEISAVGYIIDNGTFVQMGINDLGNLNVPGGTLSMPSSSTTDVGLRYIPTNGEATAPGCLCEGWGVANADMATGSFSAYANVSVGTANLVVQAGTGVTNPTGKLLPESVGSAFKSIVRDTGNRVEVIHDYKPSISNKLYRVDVTITNIGMTPIGDLRYRRVMDWDIAPFTFDEFVEIHVGVATNLVVATTDGFQSADPLSSPGPGVGSPPTTLVSGSPDYFSGPTDQGALFDFKFGSLAPGETKTFTIFYGATETRLTALNALSIVGAEVYSLGLPRTSTGEAAVNGPHAFIFAFKGVGGTPITRGLIISELD